MTSSTHTLEASQRMHLRKSSRKLEAMLGVTPIVLQVNIAAANKASVPRPLTTPRTRQRRRRAQVCPPAVSPSTSITDDDDATVVNVAIDSNVMRSDISSFIWVDGETTPHSGYVPHSLPEAVMPTHRARSKSEGGAQRPKPSKAKAAPLPGLPSSVRLEMPPRGKKSQSSAQPILVVRNANIPPTPMTPTPSHRKSSSAVTLTENLSEPLSPLSPVSSANLAEAQEREMRRKKMAKLTRTLGSNVPPELVFQGQTKKERRLSIAKARRRASSNNLRAAQQLKPSMLETHASPLLSAPTAPIPPAKKFQRAHRPKTLSVPERSPAIARVEIEQVIDVEMNGYQTPSPMSFAPVATPAIVVEAASPPPAPTPKRLSTKPLGSKASLMRLTGHVASKSTPHLGPFVPTPAQGLNGRGVASLDMERPPFAPYHAPSKSLETYRTPADYVYGSDAPKGEKGAIHSAVQNLHRRKEREWSGEWNVADMGDVMKKLRNLKGR